MIAWHKVSIGPERHDHFGSGSGLTPGLFSGQPKPRLYDCVLEVLRSLTFHNTTHRRELAERDLIRFLTHLAVDENVAGSTQNRS
jgi:hypothetical protein